MRSVVMLATLMRVVGIFSLSAADLTAEYQQFADLDELANYRLYWSVDRKQKSISFAVEVRTTGWIGFGISSGNGKMKGSDLVVGWVKDCKGYLTDRYADGYSVPVMDKHQDYELTGFSEKDGKTILKFKRKIDTCDKRDRKIEQGTTKVVYAYHPSDPNAPMDFMKHSVKGQRSLMLLNSWQGSAYLPKDMKYFDVRVDKVKVPGSDTTYWCEGVKLPTFDKKYHIVKAKPLIQKGHEGLVHHIAIYNCKLSFNKSALWYRGICHHPNMPNDMRHCTMMDTAVVWAIGSEGFTYPDDVGAPVGHVDGAKVVLMEVHYDNPLMKTDFVDSSGIRFFYMEPRKYESGQLYTGVYSSPAGLIAPPRQKSWKISGYCSKQCTKWGVNNTGIPGGGIKIFAAFLHSHLAGRKLWTKHVRDGKELQVIVKDDNYDFNFQETQHLQKEVTLLPGDEMITECVYNTMDRKTETLGGLSTRDEMCLSFLVYYPRSSLAACLTEDYDVLSKFNTEFGERNTTNQRPTWKWNSTMAEKLRQLYDDSPNRNVTCFALPPKKSPLKFTAPKPEVTTTLPKPIINCTATGKNATTYMDKGASCSENGVGRLWIDPASMIGLGLFALTFVPDMF